MTTKPTPLPVPALREFYEYSPDVDPADYEYFSPAQMIFHELAGYRRGLEAAVRLGDMAAKQSTETSEDLLMFEKLVARGAAIQAEKLATAIRALIKEEV